MNEDTHREYIGDGIYVAFDGHRIWLRKLDGNQFALNVQVFSTLQAYEQRLCMALESEVAEIYRRLDAEIPKLMKRAEETLERLRRPVTL